MTRFFNHKYRLTLKATLSQPESTKIIGVGSDVVITDLQIKGSIKSSKQDSTTNNMSIDIYNLSDTTVDLISQEDVIVQLEVGYPNQPLKSLFNGNLSQIYTESNGTDRITRVLATESLANIREAKADREWNHDVTVRKVFEDIILNDLKLAIGNMHNIPLSSTEGLNKVLKKFSTTGLAKVVLDDLANGHDLAWNIVDGEVNVYPVGSGRNDQTKEKIPIYTIDSGLIRAPNKSVINSDKVKGSKEKKNGEVFEVVLNPRLIVGGLIKVESRNFNGEAVIKELSHDFNYWQGKWQSTIIGETME